MRKFFLLICLLSTTIAFSQKDISKDIEALQRSIDSTRKITDSLEIINNKRFDSINMVRFNEQNSRNLDSFMRGMKEKEEKQKRAMWLRLGFGILMLIVLIVGLVRKRKKKESQ